MYLYAVLYYLITALRSTASDIVLAANIEDFHTLAKQFVPNSMADAILKMANDAVKGDNSKKSNKYPEFRDIESAADIEPDWQATEFPSRSEYIEQKEIESKPTKPTTSKYQLSLDDIVEKVQKKLHNELELMAATVDKKITTQAKAIDKAKIPQSSILGDGQPSLYIKFPVGHVKQLKNDVKNKSREKEDRDTKPQHQTIDKSYESRMIVAKPLKYNVDQGEPVAFELSDALTPESHKASTIQNNVSKKNNTNQTVKIKTLKRLTSTTFDVFSEMKYTTKDTYEDYDTTKKDMYYFEQAMEAAKRETVSQNHYYSNTERSGQINKNVLDIFSYEGETTANVKDNVNYEEETINYNKRKKKVSNSRLDDKYNNHDGDKYFNPHLNNRVPENLHYIMPGNFEQKVQSFTEENVRDELLKKIYGDDNEQTDIKRFKIKSKYIEPYIEEQEDRTTFETNKQQQQHKPKRGRHNR